MRLLRCLCTFLLFGTSLGVAQPPLAHAKLSMCDGLPCIDAQVQGIQGIQGKHLRLAVDTGNPNSALNLKSAEALGLSLQPINGADGKPIAGFQRAVVPNVTVGDIVFKELRFLVIDLSPSISAKTFPNVDGTIAYGAWKDRIVQLDYPTGVFSVSEPLTAAVACPVACGDISLIPFGHRGPLIVTTAGFTVNGRPISVQVDTMFTGSLLIYPTSVDKLNLTSEAQSKATQYFAYTDEGVDMFRAEARQIGFESGTLAAKAPLYFAGPKVHLPDGLFDGTVGAELLGKHKVSFDFHDNKFWLD